MSKSYPCFYGTPMMWRIDPERWSKMTFGDFRRGPSAKDEPLERLHHWCDLTGCSCRCHHARWQQRLNAPPWRWAEKAETGGS